MGILGDLESRASDLWMVNADGSNLHQLTSTKADSNPTWSPDGSQILFGRALQDTTGDGQISILDNMDMHILSLMTGKVHNISNTPEYDDFNFSWSSDGEWIVFTSVREDADGSGYMNLDDSRHLFLIRPDGSDERRIDLGDLLTFSPVWSPDGKSILFGVKVEDAIHVLYIYSVAVGALEAVTDEDAYYHADWAK